MTCQMSSAYSRMVRSEENLPLPAVYMMDLDKEEEDKRQEDATKSMSSQYIRQSRG